MSQRLRSIIAGVVCLTMISVFLGFAIQAEGRPASLIHSNDGGAWLVDSEWGGVAHIEYLTRQPTVRTLVGEPGENLTAKQSANITVVHNTSSSVVSIIDTANAAVLSETAVPENSVVAARPEGVVIYDSSSGQLWDLPKNEISAFETLDNAPSALAGDAEGAGDVDAAGGKLVVGRDGTVAVLKRTIAIFPQAEDEAKVVKLGENFEPEHVTAVNGHVVAVSANKWLNVSSSGAKKFDLKEQFTVAQLQQPGQTWPTVAAVDKEGRTALINAHNGKVVMLSENLVGAPNSQPIFFEECVHVLSGPSGGVQFTSMCAKGENRVEKGLPVSADARLRLVNGYLWIDALDGTGFVLDNDLKLEKIDDFTEAFDNEDKSESEDSENVETELSDVDDAKLVDADNINDKDPVPPVAKNDEAATRAGRSVLIDVLANDTDANSDVLLVDGVELISGNADVAASAGADAVQITPLDGDNIRVKYWVTDGYPDPAHRVSAEIFLKVLANTPDGNKFPETKIDRLVGAVGSIVTGNLIDNDTDPDGDTIKLHSIDVSDVEGLTVLSSHPNGDVILSLPETLNDGAALEVPYIVEDEWGGRSTGIVRITLRLVESNIAPDARNDVAVTQVGKRVSLNLLENDTDADGDQLFIVEPATPIGIELSDYLVTTEEGEFSFEPSAAGTYKFRYSVTDNQGSDTATVRIKVTEPEQNRAPIAARDDIILARGETRLVRALANDGDPDGDVIAIVGQLGSNPNLKIVEEQGHGFWVTMKPTAQTVETFSYIISDGQAESELAQVIVTRSDAVYQNAAPIAIDDKYRIRPGHTSQLHVLSNDFDPDGSKLTITEVTSTDSAAQIVVDAEQLALNVTVPNPNATASFAATYTIQDEVGNQASGTVEISLIPNSEPNNAPIARADEAIVMQGEPVLIDVLANDTDPDGDSIIVSATPMPPKGGAVKLSADNKGYIYTPSPGFRGSDQFRYLIRDSRGAQATGAVNIGVMPKPDFNRPPVATPDVDYQFPAKGQIINLDLLANDFDPDGDQVQIIEISGPGEIDPTNSSVNYTLPENVDRETELGFTYEISDLRGGTSTADVLMTVVPNTGLAPIANPDTGGPIQPGRTVIVDVLANDDDPDGEADELKIVEAGDGAEIVNGKLKITAPEASAEIAYTIADADGLKATSFVSVTVEPNLAPEVQTPIFIGTFANDAQIPQIDLSKYVTDPDGDPLIFADVEGQVGGITTLERKASDARLVTFETSSDHVGDAGFAFTVEDDHDHIVSGRVELKIISSKNRPPVGQTLTMTLEAGVAQPIDLSKLFTDPDLDDETKYEIVTQPTNSVTTTAVQNNKTEISAPIDATPAETKMVVKATDSGGETAEATITIELIENLAGLPEANPDSAETTQDESVTVNVLDNDIDTLGQGGLTITQTFSESGSTTFLGRDVTFTPTTNFFGTALVFYDVVDARQTSSATAQGILTVNVVGRPSTPAAVTARPLPPNSIVVNWQAPATNGSPIEKYEVEQLSGDVTKIIDAGKTPSLTINDLKPGQPYKFRTKAFNKAGESDWSSYTPEVVVDQVPSPPGKPDVKTEVSKLVVSWAEAANEGTAITNYNIEAAQCVSEKRNSGKALTYTWDQLENGERCAFRITATNDAGESTPSPWSDLECAATVPEAPAAPTPKRGIKQASITWAQPTNPDCEPITGYEIVRLPENATTLVPAGTTNWTSKPLVNGNTYRFQVRAKNRVDWGPLSAPSAPVTPCGPPLAPGAPDVVSLDRKIKVSVTRAAASNGCTVSQYEVKVGGGSWRLLPAGGEISGLTNGVEVSVSLRGVNEAGAGAPSATTTAKPFGPPSRPLNVRLDSSGGAPKWVADRPATDNGNRICKYSTSPTLGRCLPTAGAAPNPPTVPCMIGNKPCLGPGGPVKDLEDGCAQVPQLVSVKIYSYNEAGISPPGTGSEYIEGCPVKPFVTWNGDGVGGRVEWVRPYNAENVYLKVEDGELLKVNKVDYDTMLFKPSKVEVSGCNEFGCQTRTVNW